MEMLDCSDSFVFAFFRDHSKNWLLFGMIHDVSIQLEGTNDVNRPANIMCSIKPGLCQVIADSQCHSGTRAALGATRKVNPSAIVCD
jgi:hypothetical protein